MGRTNKTGIDYFPFDVDFFQDEKVQFVSERFGLKGEIIAIRLLCKIYRNGYYTEWNDDTALLFAKSVGDGCQDSFVKDVVQELLKRGFFDRSIFERFGILTSRGIQNRYFEAAKRYKKVEVTRDFLLVDVSEMINVDINPINVNINPQKKRERKRERNENEKEKGTENFCEVFDELSFENAWAMYGRKGNKKSSIQKWDKLKNHCRLAALKHIPDYVAATPDIQYRKNFETYINQEAWNDEIVKKNGNGITNGFAGIANGFAEAAGGYSGRQAGGAYPFRNDAEKRRAERESLVQAAEGVLYEP
jgi:hypothetical protein